MQHVYHWKHGWIPLDHTAAMSKAKGNKALADRYHADAMHSPGIQNRQDVAKAALDLPNIPNSADRMAAKADLQAAADRLSAHDVLPSSMRVSGVDQFGQRSTFTGHVVGQSPAHRGQQSGTVFSMHNGSDRSGIDSTARGSVFVPDVPGQAKSLTPEQLKAQNQGGIQQGQEVAIKIGGSLRVGTVTSMAPDGRLVVHVPGQGSSTRSAEDLRTDISASTRAAEAKRAGGNWSKTPLGSLEKILSGWGNYSPAEREAVRVELARRLAKKTA